MAALAPLKLPRLPLAAFRRRLVVRGVFALLIVATLALALVLLAEERQRSRQRYEAGFQQRLATLAERLRHPTGQLALLNADAAAPTAEGISPLVLPFSALDFDDPFKARHAVEMSGCAMRWADGRQLCVAVGNSAFAGGFAYVVASFVAPGAVARERGELELDGVSRARLALRSSADAAAGADWIAPFEAAADAPVQRAGGSLRGRLTGFALALPNEPRLDARARPDRDFRGWLWQDADCADRAMNAEAQPDCPRATLLSIRLPVAPWRDALFDKAKATPAWPPADLRQTRLALQWLGPGGAVLFDSAAPNATAPFALADLAAELQPGETLRIERPVGRAGGGAKGAALLPLAILRGAEREGGAETSAPWLLRLIQRLPLEGAAEVGGVPTRIEAAAELAGLGSGTPRVRLTLAGELASTDRSLGATATRLAWFVAAMLGAIALAWLVIEIGFMRRMALLTKRAAALSYNMQDPQLERRLGELEVADLRGPDELGILAGSLAELLQRVKDGARREHIRAEQEREQWHAVGHEIMSPLQSLMVLHGEAGDPSHRYVQRMQQAVRVLYGTASPSEAIAAASLEVATLDLDAFLRQVAANAAFAGIEGVRYERGAEAEGPRPCTVRADEYSLEDVVTHVLRNAGRHRVAGTPITIGLVRGEAGVAWVRIHNQGPAIAEAMLERIFEYGVSGEGEGEGEAGISAAAKPAGEHRGQGLFVARTYMAKMGGTIVARNVAGGVVFELSLAQG